MRENPKRVQKDNGGPLQIKDKDTNINIDVIWKQNVFNHWAQIILAPFFVTHNRFHLIDVTVAQKETWCWWGFVGWGEVAWLEERLLESSQFAWLLDEFWALNTFWWLVWLDNLSKVWLRDVGLQHLVNTRQLWRHLEIFVSWLWSLLLFVVLNWSVITIKKDYSQHCTFRAFVKASHYLLYFIYVLLFIGSQCILNAHEHEYWILIAMDLPLKLLFGRRTLNNEAGGSGGSCWWMREELARLVFRQNTATPPGWIILSWISNLLFFIFSTKL